MMSEHITYNKFCLLIVLALLFQQCKLYETPQKTNDLAQSALTNNFEIPEFWENITDTTEVSANWYRSFGDSNLNALIEEAVDTNNLNILHHLAIIEAGEARSKLVRTKRNVRVDYGVDYLGYSDTKGTNDYSLTGLGAITWEADLWGQIKTEILAADESLQADIFNYSYTRQSIAALVAQTYFEIGTINQIVEIGSEFLSLNKYLEDLLRKREEVGVINMKDVHLAKAQVNSINNIIENFNNQLQLKTRSLETILGRYPSNELRVSWIAGSLDPVTEIGNPIALINRRPDIKRNEAMVRSHFYLNEQAKLAKYPRIVLSADLGLSTIGDLFFGTGAGLFGPIFNGGALDNKIEIATAIQKQVLADYGLSILDAFNEVETSMHAEQYLGRQENYITASIQELKEAYKIVLTQYEVGKIDLFDLLQIQMQWLLKELDLVNIKGDLYKQRVELFLALGGDITN